MIFNIQTRTKLLLTHLNRRFCVPIFASWNTQLAMMLRHRHRSAGFSPRSAHTPIQPWRSHLHPTKVVAIMVLERHMVHTTTSMLRL